MEFIEHLISQASLAQRNGDFQAAATWLEQALARNPADKEVLLRLGRIYREIENYPKAIAAFRRALEIDPNYASAYSALGQVLFLTNRLPDAVDAFIGSINIEPTASRLVLLGDIQSRLGRDKDAEGSFRRALKLEPDNEEALLNLAISLRDGTPAEAEKLLERALQLNPKYWQAYLELGGLFLKRHLADQASSVLRKAAALKPDHHLPHLYLANALWRLNDLKGAEVEYVQACKCSQFSATPWWSTGQFYEALGDVDEADTYYSTATEIEPNDTTALFHLARFLLETGRNDASREVISKLFKLDPNHEGAQRLHQLNN